MKQRTYKAAAKRIRVSKTKNKRKSKLVHVAAGRDHYNARETGNTTRGKRRNTNLSGSFRKSVKTMIPGIK